MTDNRNRDRSRAEGLAPFGSQVLEYVGEVYQSSYDHAALADPIWTCPHRHDHEDYARDCARRYIETRGASR